MSIAAVVPYDSLGMDRATVIATLRELFEPGPEDVVAVYLFGSVARGTAGASSDVDVGIVYEKQPQARLEAQPYGMEAELSKRMGRPVQVVALNGASPDLIHRVLRDGVLVHERDLSARVRFETRARAAYFDMLPIWREYRRGRAAS